jgi:hypothetical protein
MLLKCVITYALGYEFEAAYSLHYAYITKQSHMAPRANICPMTRTLC